MAWAPLRRTLRMQPGTHRAPCTTRRPRERPAWPTRAILRPHRHSHPMRPNEGPVKAPGGTTIRATRSTMTMLNTYVLHTRCANRTSASYLPLAPPGHFSRSQPPGLPSPLLSTIFFASPLVFEWRKHLDQFIDSFFITFFAQHQVRISRLASDREICMYVFNHREKTDFLNTFLFKITLDVFELLMVTSHYRHSLNLSTF